MLSGLLGALVLAAGLAACGSGQDPTLPATGPATSAAAAATTTATTMPLASTTTAPPATLPPPSPGACPAPGERRALDADRPTYEVDARIDVPAGVVDGTVAIGFTPDLPTDRLVLRLWPNGPRPAAHVDVLAVADRTTGAPLAATQPDPTTLDVALGRTPAAGERVHVEIAFHLALTGDADDRLSRSGDTLRLGSAFPLLAWEPGAGWATEPPTSGFAEATTSPAADWTLRLDVTAGYDVLASGRRQPDGSWLAVGARDVGISVGRFAGATSSTTEALPHPVEVTVAVDSSLTSTEDAGAYLDRVVAALRAFVERYGPYPFDHYGLAITPGLGGGIEYPGHVMQGPGTIGRTTPHEVAHQWFYALVGNDQGRDPWLDEGLASWAEFRHEGALDAVTARPIPGDAAGRAGAPMSYWEGRQGSYYRGVYVQPAAALAGLGPPELVDCALRAYVDANAWRIARPVDVVDALGLVFPDAAARLAAVGIVP